MIGKTTMSDLEETAEVRVRVCEVCGNPMTYLGSAPRRHAHAARRIFRCYYCNNVVSEEWS